MHHLCKKTLLTMFIVIMRKKASYRAGAFYKEFMFLAQQISPLGNKCKIASFIGSDSTRITRWYLYCEWS